MATTDTRTDTCGCCDDASEAPRHENRPGLSALAYRIGTHGSFLRRMLEQIARIEIPDGDQAGERPLAKLTTRAPDDPAVALLDAWAALADVLTFYQERIANEGFLRTATERRSLLELARAIGYELNPGVAASAWLAFHVNDAPGSPEQAAIPTGTKAQSIPAASDEMPQIFETTEDFEAHAAWNAVAPRLTETHVPVFGETEVFIEGVAHQVQPGDHLLFVGDERKAWYGSERWDVRKVKTVELFPKEDRTRLTWDLGLGTDEPHVEPAAGNVELFVFRRRAALFGHNAPDWRAMPGEIKKAYCEELDADGNPTCPDWPHFEINVDDAQVDLDADYPKVLPGSWMALVEPNYIELYRTVEVAALTRTDFTLSTKITRVTVDIRENLRLFGLRETLALIESEALTLAERPLTAPVSGDAFDVPPLDPPFAEGQTIIVTGKRSVEDEDTVSETAVVKAVTDHGTHQTITLEEELANEYVRTTVTIYGNVVPGTHGETVNEVLGGGDGSKKNQTFTLKKKPLTYVSAATASGTESTLVIRVNGVRWDEAPSLYEAGPEDTVYTVRINDDAEATVIFGDGVHGARLPTGPENVTAAYRAGLGLDGEVDAGQLSLLMSRPYGIDGVANPLPADGAADPETTEEARTNAPRTVLTLDRIVSLRDFEDFARAFTGIGKAQATPIFNGETYLVHLTLADVTGDAVVPPLLDNLRAAIDDARDPSVEVVLASADTRTFRLKATILYDPAYVPEDLQSEAETALREAFSFDARAFAQPVTDAEILRVLHDLDGVVAVDLDALYLDADGSGFSAVLRAERARREDGALLPAQMLTLHEDGITLTMRAA